MGKNVLRKHFLSPQTKGRNVHVFFSYSMTLICNANKNMLRGKVFLKLPCKVIYLLKDFDMYFLQLIGFFLRSLSRVNTCDRRSLFISRLCTWSCFLFFGNHHWLWNIWIEYFVEDIAGPFKNKTKTKQQKQQGRLFPGSHEVFFGVCVHTFFWVAMQIHFTMCVDVLGRRRRMVMHV